MTAVNFEELNTYAGELLPERAVLSALVFGGPEGGDSAALAVAGHGGQDNPTIVSSCTSASTGGLLTVTGPQAVQTCTPSTIV